MPGHLRGVIKLEALQVDERCLVRTCHPALESGNSCSISSLVPLEPRVDLVAIGEH